MTEKPEDGALRREATADFSPAFQGRNQIVEWPRRVATIEDTPV